MNASTLQRQAWQWLDRELERWTAAGIEASFWWRDDDASHCGERLERLLELGRAHRLPLSLAVIPARLEAGLAERLQSEPLVSVLQHGYDHSDQSAVGERKLELGGVADSENLRERLALGFEIMKRQFGKQFVPVMVPPWNRIRADAIDLLPALGFRGLSRMKARHKASPAAELLEVNTHLDPVNWRSAGGFGGTYLSIAILVQHLIARRNSYRDAAEPTGILSHHLAQNEATWTFIDELLRRLASNPAVRFVSADTIWT